MRLFPFFTETLRMAIVRYPLVIPVALILFSTGIFFLFLKLKRKDSALLYALLITVSILPAARLVTQWYIYLPSAFFNLLLFAVLFQTGERFRRFFVPLLFSAYFAANIIHQINWIEITSEADRVIETFKSEHLDSLRNAEGVTFLTYPAKIDGYPVFQLNFPAHLNYKLGTHLNIGLRTRSDISSFSDSIGTVRRGDEYIIRHFDDNYFILYGIEKNYKFDKSDFHDHLLQSVRVGLSEEERKFQIFTYSKSKFIRLE